MRALLLCDDTEAAAVALLARGHGLGIEVQAFHDPAVIAQPEVLGETAQFIEGIEPRGVHGPFGDLCAGSYDPMLRDVARHRFEQGEDVARRLGAEHLVLHHGYVPGTSPPQRWLRRAAEFWRDYLDERPSGPQIHLENMLEHDADLLADLVDAIDHPRLDVCFDVGHAHCNGRLPAVSWVERLGARIGYVHLHDNGGDADAHLGLGDGTAPLVEVCHALEAHAPEAVWALETQVPFLESSLGWLDGHGLMPVR